MKVGRKEIRVNLLYSSRAGVRVKWQEMVKGDKIEERKLPRGF